MVNKDKPKGWFKTKTKSNIVGLILYSPPEWATWQFSQPEKWYTTFCQGPLGVPKNVFGLIWELNFQEKITFYWFVKKCQTKPFRSLKIWTPGQILTYLKKSLSKSDMFGLFQILLFCYFLKMGATFGQL